MCIRDRENPSFEQRSANTVRNHRPPVLCLAQAVGTHTPEQPSEVPAKEIPADWPGFNVPEGGAWLWSSESVSAIKSIFENASVRAPQDKRTGLDTSVVLSKHKSPEAYRSSRYLCRAGVSDGRLHKIGIPPGALGASTAANTSNPRPPVDMMSGSTAADTPLGEHGNGQAAAGPSSSRPTGDPERHVRFGAGLRRLL